MTRSESSEWEPHLTRLIAGEVRRIRKEMGMSAQRLADRCAELGYPVPRNVIANLESGRKESVSVAELLVVAEALEVPPVLLLFPVGHAHGTHRAPARDREPLMGAVRWFTGEQGERTDLWACDPYYENARPLRLYREHEVAVRLARDSEQRALSEEHRATQADSQADRAAALQAADFQKHVRDAQLERIRRIRAFLHHEGLLLPPMPKQLGRAVRAQEKKGDAYRELEFSMKRVDPERYWGEEDFDEPDPDDLQAAEDGEYDEYDDYPEYDDAQFFDPEDE
ncbi:helix-turn-helix domain-containing protein [Embleya sp. NPDC001921]